jgi:amidase
VIDDPFCPVASDVRQPLARCIDALGKAGVVLREGWPPGVNPLEQWQVFIFLVAASFAWEIPDDQIEVFRKGAAANDGARDTLLAQAFSAPHKRFLEMQQRQLQGRDHWRRFFREHDAFLMPTAFVAAFPHNPRPSTLETPDGQRDYSDLERWISLPTLAGLPATVAPIGRTAAGLPVGLQIVGPFLEDATPIDFAARCEAVIGGFVRPPGF